MFHTFPSMFHTFPSIFHAFPLLYILETGQHIHPTLEVSGASLDDETPILTADALAQFKRLFVAVTIKSLHVLTVFVEFILGDSTTAPFVIFEYCFFLGGIVRITV